jgi:hydroxymethylbilane synthase
MAGHAALADGRLAMTAVVTSEDGRQMLRAEAAGAPGDAESLGAGLADSLLERGAEALAPLAPRRGAS